MTDSPDSSYFVRTGATAYRATANTGGAWNPEEQHIAPAIGLLVHLLESDFASRRTDGLQLSRLSCDILGTIPIGEMEYTVEVLRPGRTIELVEARLSFNGRSVVSMRGWFMQSLDSAGVEASPLPRIPGPAEHEEWVPSSIWPGGALTTFTCRRLEHEPGRASFWLSSGMPLIDDSPVSPLARAAALFDFANGMTVRSQPGEVLFPNIDLTAHIFRTPRPGWVGFDTSVSYGAAGVGLTHSILHDGEGPLGSLAQILTVRPQLG